MKNAEKHPLKKYHMKTCRKLCSNKLLIKKLFKMIYKCISTYIKNIQILLLAPFAAANTLAEGQPSARRSCAAARNTNLWEA